MLGPGLTVTPDLDLVNEESVLGAHDPTPTARIVKCKEKHMVSSYQETTIKFFEAVADCEREWARLGYRTPTFEILCVLREDLEI
jgi:hypothetical protein